MAVHVDCPGCGWPTVRTRGALAMLSLGAVLSLTACSVAPTVRTEVLVAPPWACSSILIVAPPAFDLRMFAENPFAMRLLADANRVLQMTVSTRLNEAGNTTSMAQRSSAPGDPGAEIRRMQLAVGASNVLYVDTTRGSFQNDVPQSLAVKATLLDASLRSRLWEYDYEDKEGGRGAVPKAAQALIEAFRKTGCVR